VRRYPHRLRVTRRTTSAGVQDPDTGRLTSATAATVVYEDRCDFQDAGSYVARGADLGGRVNIADGVCFLKRTRAAYRMLPGDRAEITLDDAARTELHGELERRDLLGNFVTLRWLSPGGVAAPAPVPPPVVYPGGTLTAEPAAFTLDDADVAP
jgi:hypothetical protein